jgi:mannose-1-phosphate guanylyltransferase/phosphomannomutase
MPVRMPTACEASHLSGRKQDIAVCLLAAGIARRLEPISSVIAKPAFPLGGRIPIAELWVRKFVEAGIPDIAMNLHRVPESIRGYFGDGKRFLANITYVFEERPSGTLGGALKMFRALRERGVHPKRLFIPSGDIVSGITVGDIERMIDQHTRSGAALTMMLAPIPWNRRADFGTVILDGIAAGTDVASSTYARVCDFLEKDPGSSSNENNASNYLIETSFLMELEPYLTEATAGINEPCFDFGKHVLMGIVGRVPHLGFLQRFQKEFYGYEPGRLWYDVGNKRDYLAVNRALLDDEFQLPLPYSRYPWGWMGDNVDMDFSSVVIRAPIIIGNNCVIASGAEIGPHVVLGDGWAVHDRASIRNAVLWPKLSSVATSTPIARMMEIGKESKVDTAIVVKGQVSGDVRDQTIDVTPEGSLDVRDIDWIQPE